MRGTGLGALAVKALALLLAGLGLILVLGGGWLLILGGSAYYLLAGLALGGAGALLFRLNALGAYAYLALVVATIAWAIWEVGLNGWALVPRVVAPLMLTPLVLLALASLRGMRLRPTLVMLGGFVGAVLLGGVIVGVANRAPAPGAPGASLVGMSEPSTRDTGSDWPAFGGTYSARRYSPLAQIDRKNVRGLQRVWTFRTGDIPQDKWGAETTPLKIGSSLFLCTGRSQVLALDAATGRQLWRFDPKVSDDHIPYTAACRGVAYYEVPAAPPTDPCATRVIYGTLDGRLVAVDARDGRPCAGFGQGGAVDIKVGMGPVVPGMVSITSAPTIVRGVVVTGHQVLDGQARRAPSGVVKGFDAVTGQLRWAWDMARPDLTGYPPPGDSYTRGTPNMWTTASGDEQLGLVYLPMGNSAVDYLSASRSSAENLYATSLVALDVTTGRPRWHFQTVRKDVWDYDLGSQATLVDFPGPAGPVPALVLPSKQGDVYVLDRRTGAPLTPIAEIRAPEGGVEPAQRSPAQPISRYHTLRKADLTERDMWGMSPIDQMICRIGFRRATYAGFYTPPTTRTHWIQYPGYNGGSDWGGVAVDPRRGLIVANYNDMPNHNRLVPRAEADRKGWFPRGDPRAKPSDGGAEGAGDPQAGAPYAIQVNAGWRMPGTGLLCKQPPYGGIRAIDLATGRTVWDRPLGTARNNGPFKIPSRLPLDIGTPNNGGSAVTAGGLVFIAAATDDLIRAIDIETGRRNLTQEELTAIVDEAHAFHKTVAAHCFTASGHLMAVKAGVDTLEHTVFHTEESIEAIKNAGIWVVPTLSHRTDHAIRVRKETGAPPFVVEKMKQLQPFCYETFQKMHKAGVPIAMGTDVGYDPEMGEGAKELQLYVDLGMSPMDAILTATKNAAIAIKRQDDLGTIEGGKIADIIAVDGDPVRDITVLQEKKRIKMVMRNGAVLVDRREGKSKSAVAVEDGAWKRLAR